MAELTFLSISPKRAMNVAYCGSLKREFQHFLGKEDREKGSQIKKRSKERIDKINKVPHFCRLNSSRLEKKAIRATNPLQLLGWLFSNKW